MAWQAGVKRAEKQELESLFLKYASVEQNGERFMSMEDFVCKYLQLLDKEWANQDTLNRLAAMADTSRDGLISFVEFRSFESLLWQPDAVNQMAFQLFDQEHAGRVSFENFRSVLSSTTLCQAAPFDFDCTFVKQYFGYDKKHLLDYYDFCQLLQNLPTEHARQSFRVRDKKASGTIPALEFVELMKQIRGFRMSSHIQDHLLAVAGGSAGRRVSYPYFKAFNQMLGNLDLFTRVVKSACEKSSTTRITQVQLLQESQQFAQITPLQVHLLFELCSLEEPTRTGTIGMEEFRKMLPWPHQVKTSGISHSTPTAPVEQTEQERSWGSSILSKFMEQTYRFGLASIGGATGATAVYPIDLVKTRMQNQRGTLAGEIMYRNSFDCFFKVIKNEGFFGLYRGLLPQLIGVSPEKAIKLSTNDLMRDLQTRKDGTLPLWNEIIAGGCGGMAQVTFTNPIEIVKIRLQVAGEMGGRASALSVMKDLGFFGLYKGARACYLRDIPFSGIYFPVYAHMKLSTADSNGYNGVGSLFASAMIAGVPAAYLLTPADVIKTRLQVVAREGQQTYSGVMDCARKVYKAEGFRAFWKGGPARVFRSSPQFGVTLVTYELLQRLLPMDFGKRPSPQPITALPPTLPTPSSSFAFPDHIGGYRMVHSTFSGVESRFGLVFPKLSPNAPPPTPPTPVLEDPIPNNL